jgi:hypothetical protein
VRDVESQAHCMGFDPYPSVPTTEREAQRSQQFVPGMRVDDRVPQLSIGPTLLSPEMGRIQSKVGNVSLHDPDCPCGVGAQSQGASHHASSWPLRRRL